MDKEIIDMIEEVLVANLNVCKMLKNETLDVQGEGTILIVKNLKTMADNILGTDKTTYRVSL